MLAGRFTVLRPTTLTGRQLGLEAEPKVEWWIHLIQGDLTGWLLVSDATVRILRRAG